MTTTTKVRRSQGALTGGSFELSTLLADEDIRLVRA